MLSRGGSTPEDGQRPPPGLWAGRSSCRPRLRRVQSAAMSGNVGIVSPIAIEPISWVEARQVHPDEARDFTPWLAQHLDLLVPVLALSDLELVRVEQSIAPFRLDIRAIGSDPAGQVGVVIENQYGRTDHDHLGKLITYAAQAAVDHERVLAVWIAESTAAPHEAAIEHLNRTTQQGMGYLLLRVRFAPSPNGYYVHFEKVVAPNEFISEVLHAQSPVNPERREFMAAVYAEVDPSVRSAGYRNTWLNPNGWVIRARMPTALPLSAWCEPRLRMTSTDATVTLRFGRRGAGIAAARAALTAA